MPWTSNKSGVDGSGRIAKQSVLIKKTRSSDWVDLRKSTPKAGDVDLMEAIACVVKDQATYCYRRDRARLKIDGRQINISAFIE